MAFELKDRLGNPIKVGQFITLPMLEKYMVGKVVHIQEPSMLSAGKDNLQLQGQIIVVTEHHIPFDIRGGPMSGLIVAQTPEHLKKQN